MNILDRLVSVFSPVAGVRRAAARQVLDQYAERAYASAQYGRRNKNWRAPATSANVEVASGLGTLRNRAREFVRDKWAGQRILDVLTSHVVGTGITIVPNTGSDRADNAWKAEFGRWSEACDVEGVQNFGAMQAMTMRSMVEGGDTVTRFIDLTMDQAGDSVPFRLQGLEGDQIDTTRDRALGNKVRLGVQLGDYGVREGLWLYSEHPGEQTPVTNVSSNLVGWSDLVHLYRPLRWGQVRGISWFAPVLLNASEAQDLIEAAIVQARTQASFAGFIKRQPGGASVLASARDEKTGQPVTRIEPGMIADIGEADIVFSNPSSQSAFSEVYMTGMMAMAAGAGLTYDQLTGDLRQANYSSLRAGKIEFFRLVEQIQYHIMGPRYCRPIAARFTDRAILAGRLPRRREGYPVDLVMPVREPIDPLKDLEADIAAVRSGRMSPQEFISGWGQDWRKVVADTGAFLEAIDKAKFTLDIDPRKPLTGVVQKPDAQGKQGQQ